MRLRTQVLLLQLAVIAVSLAVGFGLVIAGADDRVRDEYAQRALAIAQSVAADATPQECADLGRELAAGPRAVLVVVATAALALGRVEVDPVPPPATTTSWTRPSSTRASRSMPCGRAASARRQSTVICSWP